MARPECTKCAVEMRIGQALLPVMSSSPDFVGEGYDEFQRGQTVSQVPGKAALQDCWKCPMCGFSAGIKGNDTYVKRGVRRGNS